MVGIELRLIFLMQGGNRVRDKIYIHDVDTVRGAKRQYREPRQKHECLDHIELRCLCMTAVAEHNARTEDRLGRIWEQYPRHVLTKFFGTGVGIVVGAVPLDRAIFSDNFVAALPGYSHCAHLTEASQAMIVLSVPRQREH